MVKMIPSWSARLRPIKSWRAVDPVIKTPCRSKCLLGFGFYQLRNRYHRATGFAGLKMVCLIPDETLNDEGRANGDSPRSTIESLPRKNRSQSAGESPLVDENSGSSRIC
jgi:hypothetical protein